MNNKLSIDTFIARKTTLSRRKIMELLLAGKIAINGTKVKNLKSPIDPLKDIVTIEGNALLKGVPKLAYYKFNKPKGVITSLADPKGRKTVSDFFGRIPEQIFPVGRLDRDSSGLLLLTNDGALAHKIAHPSFRIAKQYRIHLDKNITRADINRLQAGIFLDDGPFVCDSVVWEDERGLVLSISEGRNRIIRRAFAQMGYEVKRLKRLSIGPVQLGHLEEGKIKPLSKAEVMTLTAALREKSEDEKL